MLDFTVKFIAKIITKLLYRIEISGMENYEKVKDRCVIIANHQSLLDAALISIYLPDKPLFAIDIGWANKWWVKHLCLKVTNTISLNPFHPMAVKTLIKHMREESDRLVIFPEGRLTITGHLMKMYDGAGMIAYLADIPLLPIRIHNAQRAKIATPYLKGIIKRVLFPKIKLTICPAEKIKCPKDIRGRKRRLFIQKQTQNIMNNMMINTNKIPNTIFDAILNSNKFYNSKDIVLQDITKNPITYKNLIKQTYILANYLDKNYIQTKISKQKDSLGLLLPNLNATFLTFLASQLSGLIPAMLNYSGGKKSILDACKLAKVNLIITHRTIVEKMKLEKLIKEIENSEIKIIYLDDVINEIKSNKLKYGLTSKIKKQSKKISKNPKSANNTACILFTSGSEGSPKGVLLSHKNILSNCNQLSICLDGNHKDISFNSLPLFHAFGLVAGTIFPILNGVKTFLYPSPLHYRMIPEYIYHENATILFGTDTFLAGYARFANRFDFRSIRFIVSGGEKLKDTTKQAYFDNFGLTIYEGYGATETSPVISVNTPLSFKENTTGKLLPGLKAKIKPIKDIKTGGRLLIKGPTVMLGYYKIDNPGVLEPVKNGWYDTGDIAEIDEDNFITIKGRLKRFAKVAGEMLSLTQLESVIQKLWPEYTNAILTIPDKKKGEALILITDLDDANTSSESKKSKLKSILRKHILEHGLSTLYLPTDIIFCDSIPLLSTGKINYPKLTEMINTNN